MNSLLNVLESKEPIRSKRLNYIYFTKDEFEWICIETKTNVQIRWMNLRQFMKLYPSLKKLEEKLQETKEYYYGDSKNRKYGWILVYLVYYKRIKIPMEVLYQIRINRKEIIFLDKELCDFMNKAYEIGVINRHYSKMLIVQEMMLEVIRSILYFQLSLNECLTNMLLFKKIASKISGREICYTPLKHILIELGIKIKEVEVNKNHTINIDRNFYSSNNEFRNLLLKYTEYLNSVHPYKTVKTEISHLKSFFNFIYENYYEVREIEELDCFHIEQYINFQKNVINIRGKKNEPSTINHRIESVNKFFCFLREKIGISIKNNIITNYDKQKEYINFPRYKSKKEINILIKAISEIDEEKRLQEKMVLVLLLDTGRRIHEILTLQYNCLKNDSIFFHKLKQGKPIWQKVGKTSVAAVLKLKEYSRNINTEIYSELDGKRYRRLIPSIYSRAKNVLSIAQIRKFFVELQIKNNIIDKKGNPIFTLHDNKRNFVSNMEAAGVSPEDIAIILGQGMESLLPYEINNSLAIETLLSVEKKGILIGKQKKSNDDSYYNKNEQFIIDCLSNNDIITKNKINLIEKLQDPKKAIPLPIGECLDIDSIQSCSIILCITCQEFRIMCKEDIEIFEEFCFKMYKYIYTFKRNKEIQNLEKEYTAKVMFVLQNKIKLNEDECKKEIRCIKKSARDSLKGGTYNGKV
ncbi:tyrosine-type recombinase/integrase [Clostridium akagii]|uniref:tyrosine-type recombinase/integrase n=1 Tax=Clostridium akagii TaxID=91623 RepID=UPI000479BE99|nr:tyrosine-type recombinase/integrase [Clostridium akagii]